ncbi:uncharacterized protein BDW70DRAFT_133751 [Aspergillus foveolatus]|uniref:uncharacterized protein n=1 Tax=Aspergillus foveolatus TaxID=210207 RepID=UPI003CCD1B26
MPQLPYLSHQYIGGDCLWNEAGLRPPPLHRWQTSPLLLLFSTYITSAMVSALQACSKEDLGLASPKAGCVPDDICTLAGLSDRRSVP